MTTPATEAIEWRQIGDHSDILYHKAEGIAKITMNRPEVLNAFRPQTLDQMQGAFEDAHLDAEIGVVLLTGAGERAFCTGGDQRVRGEGGYVGDDGVPTLNVLPLQRYIRSMPKPVIALVNGYAIGGGHVLHVVCDLSLAADTARFGQSGPRVGSFDAGLGATQLARIVRAQEGPRDLVPVPPVRRPAGARHGPRQRGRPRRRARGDRGAVGARDP